MFFYQSTANSAFRSRNRSHIFSAGSLFCSACHLVCVSQVNGRQFERDGEEAVNHHLASMDRPWALCLCSTSKDEMALRCRLGGRLKERPFEGIGARKGGACEEASEGPNKLACEGEGVSLLRRDFVRARSPLHPPLPPLLVHLSLTYLAEA